MQKNSHFKEPKSEDEVKILKSNGIIVLIDDFDDLKQTVNILYQVRCNLFHGEKEPGHERDESITQAALPLLRKIIVMAWPEIVSKKF